MNTAPEAFIVTSPSMLLNGRSLALNSPVSANPKNCLRRSVVAVIPLAVSVIIFVAASLVNTSCCKSLLSVATLVCASIIDFTSSLF